MNGIIYVLKPPGMTSHDVVSFFRRLFKIKKIGHTGTLDPDAAGVLPVCIGKATKVVDYLISSTKKYRAELKLGITTDTQDASGNIIVRREVSVSEDEIRDAVNSFIGHIKQIPPMYSAVKIDGKKLYELAREGMSVERKEREVEIFDIDLIKYNEKDQTILFDVLCSKGTYIRTLCNDIGEKLGCGGHTSFLLRTMTAGIDIKDCYTLDEISELYISDKKEKFLVPLDVAFLQYKRVTLKDESKRWLQSGSKIYSKDIKEKCEFDIDSIIRIYDSDNNFLALYKVAKDERCMFFVPEKMFI